MALSIVMVETNSDIKSMNTIKDHFDVTDALSIQISTYLQLLSPIGNESSSGINSLFPSVTTSTRNRSLANPKFNTPSVNGTALDLTNFTSKESRELAEKNVPVRVVYGERDILNLGANLREPSWHMWDPRKPHFSKEDEPIFKNSVYFFLDRKKVIREDYQLRICNHCEFPLPTSTLYS